MNKGDLWDNGHGGVGPVCSKGVLFLTYNGLPISNILSALKTLGDDGWVYSKPKEFLLPLEFLK